MSFAWCEGFQDLFVTLATLLSLDLRLSGDSPMTPANAPKGDTWIKRVELAEKNLANARELFELVSLPVLQVVAAGLNFLFVVFTGRGHFTLPFKSIDDVLAASHFPARVSGDSLPA